MNEGKQSGPEAGGGGQGLEGGQRLEEFVIKRVLGTGGFGITYLAEDTSLGREVVIKENLPVQFAWREPATGTVRPRDTTGGDVEDFQWSLRNFLQEAETLASLDHPGIVRVLRKFEANGTAYFVMPFVEGVTLDALIERRKAKNQPFSEEEVRGFLLYMLASLGYLHERGIYHRDIKPGNVLVTMEGEPILIDFGSARQRLSERSMTVIESAGYTPFEQLQSRGNVGPWSDLYALGATLVKAITFDTPPKAADRMMGDPWKGLASNPEWMSLYSAGTLASIDRSMAVDPADRWQSAENWSTALSHQQSERASTGALPPPLTNPITRDRPIDAGEHQSAQTSHAATARGPAVTADAGVTSGGKRKQNSRGGRKWALVVARLAVEWYRKAAAAGNDWATSRLKEIEQRQ